MTHHSPKRALTALITTLLLLGAGGALAQSGTEASTDQAAAPTDPVVLRLGSYEERASEIGWRFGVALRGIAAQQGQPYSDAFETSLWSLIPYYLDQRAQEVALAAEAARRGLTPDMEALEATMARIAEGLDEGQELAVVVQQAGFPDEDALRGMIMESDVIQQLMGQLKDEASAKVTDDQVRLRYLAERGRFTEAEQYCAKHILVADEPVAQSILDRLGEGADFGALAAELGTDGTKDRGGDLGCFGLGAMIPEFEAAVVSAPVGENVGPVATQFGYHVVQVYGHTPARVKPFAEVQETAREMVVAMATDAAIQGIVEGAGVVVYPERLPSR